MTWWCALIFGIAIIPIRPVAGFVIAAATVLCVIVAGVRDFRDPIPDCYQDINDIDKED